MSSLPSIGGSLSGATVFPARAGNAAMHAEFDAATFGEGEDLLFVMGWGNRLDGDNERWVVDRLVERGYEVHAVQLPTNAADFEADYLDPVRERYGRLDDPTVVSHSTGGLVVAYLRPGPAVYLAPWWGVYGMKLRGAGPKLAARLPVETPLLPIDFGREEVGALVTDEQWDRLPKRVSPAFMRTVLRAQDERPPVSEEAVVFVSLRDTVVSKRAVGEAVAPEQVRLYDGGHELFASEGREELVEPVLAAVGGT